MKKTKAILGLVLILVAVFSLPRNAKADWKDIAGPALGAGASCAAQFISAEAEDKLESLIKVPVTNSKTTAMALKQNCFDVIAKAAAQVILRQITSQTVAWVNSGFKGAPFYLQNQNSYFKSLGDEQFDSYLITLLKSNNPYSRDTARSLVQNYTGINRQGFTLDQDIGPNWQDFGNDFSVGGWDGFLSATQNDENNPLGTEFVATDSASKKIETKKEEQKQELANNRGFLSFQKCVGPSNYRELPNNLDRRELVQTASGDPTDPDVASAKSILSQYPECTRWETQTPGTVIADKLTKSVNTTEDQLISAKDLNESLTSVFTALVTQLFNKGVSSLAGNNTFTPPQGSGGSGSNATPVGYQGTGTSGGVSGTGSVNWDETYPDFNIFTDIPAVITTQQNYATALATENQALNAQIYQLKQLDFCIPGPSRDWETRASQRLSSVTSTLLGSADEDGDISNSTIFSYLGFRIDTAITSGIAKVGGVLPVVFEQYRATMNNKYFAPTAQMPAISGTAWVEIAKITSLENKIENNNSQINQAQNNIYTLNYLQNQLSSNPSNVSTYRSIFNSLPLVTDQSVTDANTNASASATNKNFIVSLIQTCKNTLSGSPYGGDRLPYPGISNDYNLPMSISSYATGVPIVDSYDSGNGTTFYFSPSGPVSGNPGASATWITFEHTMSIY